jgi:hypothetical protein
VRSFAVYVEVAHDVPVKVMVPPALTLMIAKADFWIPGTELVVEVKSVTDSAVAESASV